MSSLREKLEKVHSLLINEENEQAELLFHEAFVEAAREIHKGIMEEEDWLDESDDDEVDEAIDVDAASDEIENEEQNESFYAEVTPLGEVEEDDDEAAGSDDEVGGEFGMDDEGGEEGEELAGDDLEGDMGDEEAEEGDIESRIADLEADLEALKSEFEELEDDEMSEPENNDVVGDDDVGDEADEADEDDDTMDEGMLDDETHISEDEIDALDESFELENVSNSNDESGIGSGKGFDPSLNKTSPIPQKKGTARQGGSAVNVNAKGSNHKGFEREAAPNTNQLKKFKNVRSTAKEDTSQMSKEGDSSAAINKTESEFGKGNVTSPIGSKGSVQTKGLTESRKRKS
jgi:hypothetical protein